MKDTTALKIRKFIPKGHVKRVELFMRDFLEVAVHFEAGLIGEEQAQRKMSSLLVQAIADKVIAPSNVGELLGLAQSEEGKNVYEHLKKKY